MTGVWPHWENRYRGKAVDQAGGSPLRATSSRRLLGCADKNTYIVGDGAPVPVDELRGARYIDLTVAGRAIFRVPFSQIGHESDIHPTAVDGEQ